MLHLCYLKPLETPWTFKIKAWLQFTLKTPHVQGRQPDDKQWIAAKRLGNAHTHPLLENILKIPWISTEDDTSETPSLSCSVAAFDTMAKSSFWDFASKLCPLMIFAFIPPFTPFKTSVQCYPSSNFTSASLNYCNVALHIIISSSSLWSKACFYSFYKSHPSCKLVHSVTRTSLIYVYFKCFTHVVTHLFSHIQASPHSYISVQPGHSSHTSHRACFVPPSSYNTFLVHTTTLCFT